IENAELRSRSACPPSFRGTPTNTCKRAGGGAWRHGDAPAHRHGIGAVRRCVGAPWNDAPTI
ncbi:MAG: hypothetical protein ACK46D_11550, partial [Roseiflexaceae bacterium]